VSDFIVEMQLVYLFLATNLQRPLLRALLNAAFLEVCINIKRAHREASAFDKK